jgi:spore coat polysaccharide biosynthesis predicted glycosyltransferase SpsG
VRVTQRVLFRVAAGPRVGFGHLVRSQRLAKALGIPAVVAVDAGPRVRTAASVLGSRIVTGARPALLRSIAPVLLIVDHPRPGAARLWIREARDLGIPTASIHDLGIAPCDSDLSIDGTITPGPADLAGVRYAILDPALQRVRRRNAGAGLGRNADVGRKADVGRRAGLHGPPVVLIAFGGGHRLPLARAVAKAIVARRPDARVRIAVGFGRKGSVAPDQGITLVPQQASLAGEYRRATVAVLGGGVSLYEACAVGVPAVGVSIVEAQRPTVAGLARRRAVVDGGDASAAGAADRIARLVCDLIDAPGRRRALTRSAMRLVDGRGVERVATALRRLMRKAHR